MLDPGVRGEAGPAPIAGADLSALTCRPWEGVESGGPAGWRRGGGDIRGTAGPGWRVSRLVGPVGRAMEAHLAAPSDQGRHFPTSGRQGITRPWPHYQLSGPSRRDYSCGQVVTTMAHGEEVAKGERRDGLIYSTPEWYYIADRHHPQGLRQGVTVARGNPADQ